MLNPYEDHPYLDPMDLSDILDDATSKLECLAQIISWCGWKQDEYEVLLHSGEHLGGIISDYVRVVKTIWEKLPHISGRNPGLFSIRKRATKLREIIDEKGCIPEGSRAELNDILLTLKRTVKEEVTPTFDATNFLNDFAYAGVEKAERLVENHQVSGFPIQKNET